MAMRRRTTRRTFLGNTTIGAAAATASGLVPYVPWTATAFANQAANDRPGIGCIGTGSMGMGDAIQHAQFGDILAVNNESIAAHLAVTSRTVWFHFAALKTKLSAETASQCVARGYELGLLVPAAAGRAQSHRAHP